MTLRDTQEAHGALLTAGAVMIGLGVALAAFPNGFWLGAGFAIAGAALALVITALAWKDWRRPAPLRGQDPDRFWNAEKRWGALIGGSASSGLTFLAASLLFPSEQRWLVVGISAFVFVLAATARLILRKRQR
jgi:hypothetical protein